MPQSAAVPRSLGNPSGTFRSGTALSSLLDLVDPYSLVSPGNPPSELVGIPGDPGTELPLEMGGHRHILPAGPQINLGKLECSSLLTQRPPLFQEVFGPGFVGMGDRSTKGAWSGSTLSPSS